MLVAIADLLHSDRSVPCRTMTEGARWSLHPRCSHDTSVCASTRYTSVLTRRNPRIASGRASAQMSCDTYWTPTAMAVRLFRKRRRYIQDSRERCVSARYHNVWRGHPLALCVQHVLCLYGSRGSASYELPMLKTLIREELTCAVILISMRQINIRSDLHQVGFSAVSMSALKG